MPAPKTFNNVIIGQFVLTGIPIKVYVSGRFLTITDADDIEDIEIISHVWKQGDRYSKLAHKHYGDARFWWVLAWFNQLPTESHISYGDVVYIPTPLEDIIEILEG